MTTDAVQSRIEREREFHNKEFADSERAKISSLYLITRTSTKWYENFLHQHAQRSHILEYGCGPNSYAFWLAQQGAQVIGIDISDTAIEQMNERAKHRQFPDRVSFQRMNAEALEFPDNTFDVICGRAILHHLDLRKAFSEIARTLKPNGSAIFVEPLGHNPIINAYRNRTPDLRTEDEHPLMMSDLNLAKEYFGKVETQYFHLGSLAAAPLVGMKIFDPILNLLDGVDSALFKVLPFMRKHAWAVVLVFSEPRQ
ncbi:MAG TPA: class I SAM-dependent methyltransferase [Blastocatellia bacterium]|nr:class I SAM-dependent methyltransferase [Blastocatellia bacterium]